MESTHMPHGPVGRNLLVLLGSVAATVLLSVVLERWPVSPATVALVLLLVVLGTATIGHLWTAIAASVVATLAFNFFFLPPVRTFTIADPHHWVALFVFLAVAVIGSHLSAAAQERASEAARADLSATLLASLSHDLRTPLTAIKLAIENLSGDLTPDDRRSQAEAGAAEADRLVRFVQEILEMARVDAGAVHSERQWVAPREIVDAAATHVRTLLMGHPLDVETDEDSEAEVDPRLVSAALAHLLENAAQYSPAGSPIHVRGLAKGEGLTLVVTDQGLGLDPHELPHLFERFFRGRAGKATSGSGMGLSITQGLLAAVGGRVWAENAHGAGARFSMVVPARLRMVIAAG
jgi:two-component system, OmpR family, sensor histidine kinase KdpD